MDWGAIQQHFTVEASLKNPVAIALPFFAVLIGIELLAFAVEERRERRERAGADEMPSRFTGFRFADSVASISMGAGSIVSQTVLKFLILVLYSLIYVHLTPLHLDPGAWWYWPLVILATDFFYYFSHRMAHRVRLAWASHQAHHSSVYFNLSTALRQKWNPWHELLAFLPLPFLGFAPWTIVVAFAINLVYQFWVHTELVDRLPRPVEFVLNTPSHHRVHHGSDPIYLDKNYGGILIIWDRVFGSFQPEVFRPTYGLTHQVSTFNPVALQFDEYRNVLHDVRTAPSWRHRFGHVFGPPGWTPRTPHGAPGATGEAPSARTAR